MSGWSADGVTTDNVTIDGDLAIVQCSSLHLTSFACLVDVSGAQVQRSRKQGASPPGGGLAHPIFTQILI